MRGSCKINQDRTESSFPVKIPFLTPEIHKTPPLKKRGENNCIYIYVCVYCVLSLINYVLSVTSFAIHCTAFSPNVDMNFQWFHLESIHCSVLSLSCVKICCWVLFQCSMLLYVLWINLPWFFALLNCVVLPYATNMYMYTHENTHTADIFQSPADSIHNWF